MGSDRAANRVGHYGANTGVSGLHTATASARRYGFRDRIDLFPGAATGPVLPETLRSLPDHGGNSAGRSGLSFQQRWERGGGETSQRGRLRKSSEHFAFEQ